MRKYSLIPILFIILILFAACAPSPAPLNNTDPTINSTTNPPTAAPTSSPTKPTDPLPTEPDPDALTADKITELQSIYQLLLTDDLRPIPNFYNTALGLEYSDPRDISLSYFFRQGDYSNFANTVMTDEEYAFLKANDRNAEFLDWYRISTQDVNRVLQMCFGISLSDMNDDDISRLLYWEETDCYYSGTTSPAPYANNLEITGGTHLEDGNLKVFYNTQETKDSEIEKYVMTLKPVDGGYHILSNLKVEE